MPEEGPHPVSLYLLQGQLLEEMCGTAKDSALIKKLKSVVHENLMMSYALFLFT